MNIATRLRKLACSCMVFPSIKHSHQARLLKHRKATTMTPGISGFSRGTRSFSPQQPLRLHTAMLRGVWLMHWKPAMLDASRPGKSWKKHEKQ